MPNEIEIFSGSAYIIATREFIYWTMRSEISENLIKWSQDTFSPDEMIWATLTRIKEAPGMILVYLIYPIFRLSWGTWTIDHDSQGRSHFLH